MDIQLKKGILDVCVLYAISEGESYGYKIISDLTGIIEISESTLYPILKRLEVGGFVVTRTAEFSGRLTLALSCSDTHKRLLLSSSRHSL